MKINNLLNEYAQSHQNKLNILIHKICVPLIVFSIIGLVISTGIMIMEVPLLFYIFALVMIYYLSISFKYTVLALPFYVVIIYGNFVLASYTNLLYASLIIFVISWLFQFIGHKIEGKKPSFFKDLQFLLIGPLWVIKSILKIKDS